MYRSGVKSKSIEIGRDKTASGSIENSNLYIGRKYLGTDLANDKMNVILGILAKAKHQECVSVGYVGQTNVQYSTSLGYNAKCADSDSVSLGYNCTASSLRSTGIGRSCTAGGDGGIAIGYEAMSGGMNSISNTIAQKQITLTLTELAIPDLQLVEQEPIVERFNCVFHFSVMRQL
jgi:hypothetical protein